MKPAVKWGIAAVSGIALFAALKKMSDANAEETARTQAELKQTREQIEALQANNAIAASTATPATSDNFVILPVSPLKWQNLSGSTGDNMTNKQALIAWILNNVPQACQFTGIYQPNMIKSMRGYKYKTDADLTKCYIGVEVWSIFNPSLITTFGINKGVWFEEQIGG